MQAIAPNLSIMVGELVGARLIGTISFPPLQLATVQYLTLPSQLAHAGSLLSLAKYPASTVQILGAEKALFRALKTKHETPKYGLIYHASLVGQATPKNKGKVIIICLCLRGLRWVFTTTLLGFANGSRQDSISNTSRCSW